MAKKSITDPDGEVIRRHSRIGDTWRQFRRNKLAVFGLCLAVILILVAVFANFLAPYDPNIPFPKDRLAFPSAEHLCGTDNFGRDLFSRILYGARVSPPER